MSRKTTLTGNWEFPCSQKREQHVIVSVPADPAGKPLEQPTNPELLDLGPGWVNSVPSFDREEQTFNQCFTRYLDENGRIDFSQYPPGFNLSCRFRWEQWQYQGSDR